MWYFEMVFTRYVGKFGMVSLYETLIHTASKALVCWLHKSASCRAMPRPGRNQNCSSRKQPALAHLGLDPREQGLLKRACQTCEADFWVNRTTAAWVPCLVSVWTSRESVGHAVQYLNTGPPPVRLLATEWQSACGRVKGWVVHRSVCEAKLFN
jgi:hypothetical protein